MVAKFKVGDRVQRIGPSVGRVLHGMHFDVTSVDAHGCLELNGHPGHVWRPGRFALVTDHLPERKVGQILFDAPETQVTAASGGNKGQKPVRYDLIPWQALAEVAYMYGKGAEKYGEHNFEKGYEYSRCLAALQRHLEKFKSGETFDEENGCHHLAAVVFHANALMYFQATGGGTDDRHNS